MSEPKILFLDIETSYITAAVWGLRDQNVSLNQILRDWELMSMSAKWKGSTKVMYKDRRDNLEVDGDKELAEWCWELLNEADIVVTQNGKRFDIPKLYARFLRHDLKKPAPFQQMDTLLMSRKFGLTSHKLEYMLKQFCVRYEKKVNRQFQGMDLWTACMNGVRAAWREMKEYNCLDTLGLEELYEKLATWGTGINFNVYGEGEDRCNCGSKDFQRRGYCVTTVGRYQRYQCSACGAWSRGGTNLLPKSDRKRGIA